MITGLRVVVVLWTLLLFLLHIHGSEIVKLKPASHKLFTTRIVPTDFGAAFDNNQDTQALIHSEKDEDVEVLITLSEENEISSVEIITDLPASLSQTVRVGYAQDNSQPSPSLALDCVANRTATLCKPHCGQGTQGVAGKTILWTLKRIRETGWTRVYDVVIRGRPYEPQLVVRDKVADLVLLKPYYDHGLTVSSTEECDKPIWKLIDSSPSSSADAPIIPSTRNLTIYFGQPYSVSKLGVIMGQADEVPSDIAFHFGGRKELTKILTLSTDCTIDESDLNECPTDDLSGYPFTNVTFNAKGLVKIHIYGMPFYYPRIGILAGEKHTSPDSEKTLELTCVAASCGQANSVDPRTQMSHPTTSSCSRYGQSVACKELELLRLRIPLPDESVDTSSLTGTQLTSTGAVLPEISQVMTELNVIRSSNSELVVTMPRTHHYYGQYKCRCLADDTISSILESPPTQLTTADFDLDFVFQRNYTAVSSGDEVRAKLGFLELKPDDQDAFFRLMVEGHSLTDKLELNVSYSESGSLTSITGEYAQMSVTEAFPTAENAQYAWPIPVYKVSLQEAWPDNVDGEQIHVNWKTTDTEGNVRELDDYLRIIVLDPKKAGTVRAWTWRRIASELDMRAYYQMGQTDESIGTKRVYLQRSGCAAETTPQRISTVVLSGSECRAESGEEHVTVERTAHGCAIQFKISQPSASDQYAIYVESADETSEDELLANSAGMVNNLQSEINATDISIKFVSIQDEPDSHRNQLNALVTIHSKAIVDSSGCRSMYLILHPTWPVDEQLEKRVKQSDTAFTFAAPRDQKILGFDLELRIDATGSESPELRTRRSLTIPHPMAYQFELHVDNEKNEVSWSALPTPFVDLLQEFEVKVSSMIRACGNQIELSTPTVHEQTARHYRDPTTYAIRMNEIQEVASNPNLLADYEVVVTPMLKTTGSGSVAGASSSVKFVKGELGQTTIKVDDVVTSRERRVLITPSQMDSCLKDTQFTVNHVLEVVGEGESRTPSYLEQVSLEPDENSPVMELGRWYVLKGLQPGRRYELKAAAQYVTGEKDQDSDFVDFWTKDEISVSKQELVVSPGEKVSVDCVATVGPSDAHQKRVEWKRADGYPLPDGGRVEITTEATEASGWRQTTSLVFDKVEQGQASVYGCFVEPSVEQAVGVPLIVPQFKLIVSEMELDIASKTAEAGEEIQVRCSSKQADELIWLDPTAKPIPMAGSEDVDTAVQPYTTISTDKDETDNDRTIVLHIPRVTITETGDYTCRYPKTGSDRIFRLRLKENIQLDHDDESSSKSGETLKLRCSGQPGLQGRQLLWYKRTDKTESWIPLSVLLEQDSSITVNMISNAETNEMQTHMSVINSPDTNAQFACAFQSDPIDFKAPLKELPESNALLTNVIQPVIQVSKLDSTNEQEVLVQCRGYPAHSTDRLQWVFLPEGDPTRAIPIGHGTVTSVVGTDDELPSKVKSTFRLGDNTPATWPGASGPELLAAASKIVARNAETTPMTPEQLELILHKPESDTELDEQLRAGSVACQYRRPKSVVVMEGSVPLFVEPSDSQDGSEHAVLVQEQMTLVQMLDPTTKTNIDDSRPPVAAAGSGLISGGDDNEGNFAMRKSVTPILVHLTSIFGFLCWWLWL